MGFLWDGILFGCKIGSIEGSIYESLNGISLGYKNGPSLRSIDQFKY